MKKILLAVILWMGTAAALFAEVQSETATFAGGCFWCMESVLEKKEGVLDVVSGYSGGNTLNPRYEDYAEGGHVEVVQVSFDSSKVSYEELLDVFWSEIDPTDPGGQFADRGAHYRTVIYYHDERQKEQAEASKEKLDRSGKYPKPIVTEIAPASPFYPAESHHQDYSQKQPLRYQRYRAGSGRAAYVEAQKAAGSLKEAAA